jgi:hypothetical protein
LKKLKQEALKGKKLKQSNELGSNALLVEQLMDNNDPYLKNKLHCYKLTLSQTKSPSFLTRMEKDSNVRKLISKVIE